MFVDLQALLKDREPEQNVSAYEILETITARNFKNSLPQSESKGKITRPEKLHDRTPKIENDKNLF